MPYDEITAERVRDVLSQRRDVTAKKLMGGLCFMVNGNMCCSVSARGGLLIRVGAAAHETALGKAHVSAIQMRGRDVTGFVRVAPEGYRTAAALKKWIKLSLDFVATLPAKSSRTKSPRKTRKGSSKR